MNTKRRAFTAVLCLMWLFPLFATAQWSGKPYTEWSEKEALKLLHDSPWAQTVIFSDLPDRTAAPNRDADSNRTIDVGGSRINRAAQINFRICLLSAKPVRQAISRLIEIKQGGNINQELAAQLKSFAEEDTSQQVIVTVLFDAPRPSTRFFNLRDLLDKFTTAELKNKAYLSVEGGSRLPLQEYLPPGETELGARFVFPRFVEGKPLVTLENREIRFHAELGGYLLDESFKVRNMIYKNRLEY